MEKVIDMYNHILIGADTDAMFLCKHDQSPWTKEEQEKFLVALNAQFPEHINFEHDGIYTNVVISKAKNYVMKKENGDLLVKGSSFKSSNKEPILKQFQIDLVNEMLENNNLDTIKNIYKKYINEAKNIKNINLWASKKTFTEKIQESERANETKVMDAIKEGLDKGVLNSIQQGDKIYLYQTIEGTKQKMKKGEPQFYKKTGEPMLEPNKILRLVELYNNDADTEHYIDRVNSTLQILENVLNIEEIMKEEK